MNKPIGPAQAYADATRIVERETSQRAVGNDPTTFAYMLARAALLSIRTSAGSRRAAELAYSIADELIGGGE